MRMATVNWRPLGVLFSVITLLAGCASDRPKPTTLTELTPKIAGRQVWAAQLPSGVEFDLAVAARDGRVALASSNGTIQMLDAEKGQTVWSAALGERLSAGVGSDGRFAAAVTQSGQVVVLDGGREIWRKPVRTSVTTAPLVAGERVFVLAVDRSVHAFDALDGRRLWVYRRSGEALTLAQPGVLLPFKNTLLVGNGPRLVALDPLTGEAKWDVAVAITRGTNEVERLSDLVGPAMRRGNQICARAFQAGIGCVEAERGSLLWSRNHSGATGLAGDDKLLFGADANDRITAWRAATGEQVWSNETLLYRSLTAPFLLGRSLVMGDIEGRVHFFDPASGEVVLRLPTDGSPIVGQPMVAGTTLVVVTRKGGVYGFRPE
jgi:outer membrane protein assembly factor BamB